MFILLLIIAIALWGAVATMRELGIDGYHREPVRESKLVALRH